MCKQTVVDALVMAKLTAELLAGYKPDIATHANNEENNIFTSPGRTT